MIQSMRERIVRTRRSHPPADVVPRAQSVSSVVEPSPQWAGSTPPIAVAMARHATGAATEPPGGASITTATTYFDHPSGRIPRTMRGRGRGRRLRGTGLTGHQTAELTEDGGRGACRVVRHAGQPLLDGIEVLGLTFGMVAAARANRRWGSHTGSFARMPICGCTRVPPFAIAAYARATCSGVALVSCPTDMLIVSPFVTCPRSSSGPGVR